MALDHRGADLRRPGGRAAPAPPVVGEPGDLDSRERRSTLRRWRPRAWSLGRSLLATFLFVIAFRGGIDVLVHKLIPRASLYGAGRELLAEDVVARRRVWYWRHKYRVAFVLGLLVTLVLTAMALTGVTASEIGHWAVSVLPLILILGIQIPLLFLANLLIMFGPMLFFGLKQMKGSSRATPTGA